MACVMQDVTMALTGLIMYLNYLLFFMLFVCLFPLFMFIYQTAAWLLLSDSM